jgi:hypothetical protein
LVPVSGAVGVFVIDDAGWVSGSDLPDKALWTEMDELVPILERLPISLWTSSILDFVVPPYDTLDLNVTL